jgi:hypothetical protein
MNEKYGNKALLVLLRPGEFERPFAAQGGPMVNIKARGFDSPEQLREHLEELDDNNDRNARQNRQLRREIASLRAQLEDLKIRVEEGWTEAEDRQQPAARPSPLSSPILLVTAALGLAFILAFRASSGRRMFLYR